MTVLGRGARAASRMGTVAACAVACATLAASCRGAHEGPADGAADLQRDLDAAAASAAFAPPIRSDAPARFVSALELGASADPAGGARTTAPREHAANRTRARRSAPPRVTLVRAVRAQRTTTTAIAGEQVADASPVAEASGAVEEVASASAGAGTYTAPIETATAASPAPSAGAGHGAGQARGRSGGGWNVVGAVLGTALGVVIRGGAVGPDHCDIHARRDRVSGETTDPRRQPVFLPGGRRLPAGAMGGFIGVSLTSPPHVVADGPTDRPMGDSPRRPGRL